jgi:hypothetical protein
MNIALLKQGLRSSARCWKDFMLFVMEDTSKCQKLYVMDTRKQTVQVLPIDHSNHNTSSTAVMDFIVDCERQPWACNHYADSRC